MNCSNRSNPTPGISRRGCLTSILAWGSAVCLPTLAPAQGAATDIDMAGGRVTSAQIVEALKRQQGARRTRTRRLQLPGEGAADTPARTESARLSFDQVTFAFASAQIPDAAASILKAMGEALVSPQLQGMQFLIEGHTDTVGGHEFNMRLSVRRADAVKRHLVGQHGVDAERLFIAGKGPTELRDPANPEAGINRRVVLQAFAEAGPAG